MDEPTNERVCPECTQGELITIEMMVGDRDLSFTTCHFCEAKWWHKDGEQASLQQVIGSVADTRSA